jgi:hypothetical protein
MTGASQKQQLKLISPSEIAPNPENPRLIFRQEEMESLMLSIDRHGIQVPSRYIEMAADTGSWMVSGAGAALGN